MSRATLILWTDELRRKAAHWCMNVPKGTRVEFKEIKRTLPQNDKMWAMLTDVSRQHDHMGKRYTVEQWKAIFMSACGHELTFIPSLDGKTFIPWGNSSSDLGVSEMRDLIEFMLAWGAENNIVWSDPKDMARAA